MRPISYSFGSPFLAGFSSGSARAAVEIVALRTAPTNTTQRRFLLMPMLLPSCGGIVYSRSWERPPPGRVVRHELATRSSDRVPKHRSLPPLLQRYDHAWFSPPL